jgi:glycosyltransferase involved in cell wall biosynthesis
MTTDQRAPRLLHVFSNFVASGPELRAVALMNAFGRRYSHLVLSMDGRTSALEYVSPEVDVRVLDAPSKRGSVRTARILEAMLQDEAPDALLTYNWGAFDAILAAWMVGLNRIVHHEDGFNADEADRFKRRRVWARRLVLPSVSAVVVPSHTLAGVAEKWWRITPPLLQMIPNGVALSRLAPTVERGTIRRALAIPDDAFLIGTVAHLRPEKRLDRLIDLLASFAPERRPHAVVVGEGSERDALLARARERGVEASFHLAGAHKNVGDYLRACDVYAITSDTEQMPVSLLEAMACELPVVSTRVGDVAQVLPPTQHTFTVPLSSDDAVIRAMAAACALLEADPTERRTLGRLNLQQVETHYSFDVMLRRYQDVYDSVLSLPYRTFEPALVIP